MPKRRHAFVPGAENPTDQASRIAALLRDLEIALSLGAPREVVGAALDRLSRSLALRNRRSRDCRPLLRRVLDLHGDWRRGGDRLGRQSLSGLKSSWERMPH